MRQTGWNFFGFMASISAIVLLSAYLIEYIGLASPCKLCVYQRVPYLVSIFLCGIAYLSHQFRRVGRVLITGTMLVSTSLAFFHVGVEHKWFEYQSSCATSSKMPQNIAEFKAQLEAKDLAPCDQAHYKLFDLSLANWNFIISMMLFLYSVNVLLTKRTRK